MPNIEINMKYSKNRHYRDQEVIIEKEIKTLRKKIKKEKKKSFFKKVLDFFKF
jgi:hypothetical protein